jgi:thymidylate synthase
MRTYEGETFAEVYERVLTDVYHTPEYESSPRGMKIKEVTNAALVIHDPLFPLYENERRGSQLKYIGAELLWYFTGRNDVDFIERFAKFWRNIENGDGTVNSAYGNLIFKEINEHDYTQWEWAYNSLINDKDSRQAIMHFNQPKHQVDSNKDFVCTLTGIFQIRNNKLNFTIDMRSNDLILGTPTDIAFFCLLQQQMLKLLQPAYPELELGTYTHIVHSIHVYERHFKLVKEMLDNRFLQLGFPPIRENLVDVDSDPHPFITEFCSEIEEGGYLKGSKDRLINWIGSAVNGEFEDRIYKKEITEPNETQNL